MPALLLLCKTLDQCVLASFSFIEISPFSELFDDVLRVFAVVTLNPSIGKDFNVSGALVAHVNQHVCVDVLTVM